MMVVVVMVIVIADNDDVNAVLPHYHFLNIFVRAL